MRLKPAAGLELQKGKNMDKEVRKDIIHKMNDLKKTCRENGVDYCLVAAGQLEYSCSSDQTVRGAIKGVIKNTNK